MGWLDDARKKAEHATEEAKVKAAKKAASAALAATGAAVSKSVEGFFEGIVSSAEASLAEAEGDAKERGLKLDEPVFAEADAVAKSVEQDIEHPGSDPLGAAVRRAEAQVLEDVSPPTPTPVRSSDPFADAAAAIRMAREARGLDPDPPEPVLPDRSHLDPVASALAAAAEARAHASSGGVLAQAREDAARDQLATLKAAMGQGSSRDRDDNDDSDPEVPATKKRTL